ncbi:MAG: hypothetical protein LBJ90_08655 [Treponema sp.]|jgi:hypothetical protein|nr:hypothetical protein [Treponema sp.]
MAIQPIDLQTLFTQLDKVGKAQSAQREGLAVQQDLYGAQMQRKTEEHIRSVNEAQDMGEGAEKINDRGQRGGKEQESGEDAEKEKASSQEEGGEEKKILVIRDPALGRNIDISL